MQTTLTDNYIDETYMGLLHSKGQELPISGQEDIYDGNGNKSSLKLGRACEGATICGPLTITGSLNIGDKTFLDLVYPTGSIYLSVSPTNPATLFGGTWTQVATGKFLVGVGVGQDSDGNQETFSEGETNIGTYKHTLKLSEMPEHNHAPIYLCVDEDDNPDVNVNPTFSVIGNNRYGPLSEQYSSSTGPAGSSQPHNNIPPSFGVYMWRRIS